MITEQPPPVGNLPLHNHPVRQGALLAATVAFLIGLALYLFLHGWRRDIRVPFHFATDGLFYLMQSKSTIDNGWWWFNPMVGAPFGLDEVAFPSNSNTDQVIVWAVSRLVRDPLAAINLAWALIVVLSGLIAAWCFRTLGVSRASAVVAAVLFALSPYALYRNIAHFGMVIYLVPFACTVALQLVSGCLPERGYLTGRGAALLAGCGLLAFDYIYYPFFGCFLVACGTVVGFLTFRRRDILRAGGVCLALIVVCSAVNLAPSLYSWSRHGKPIIFEDKQPAHAELFGLKIRSLVSPVTPNRFPPFRWWNNEEAAAQFPLEGETWNARLGLIGSLGFLLLLGVLLVPGAADRFRTPAMLLGASRLNVAALLLATIGGFGSLFSLLVSTDIRAYARICPFIEFLALGAAAFAIDAFFTTSRRRIAAAAVALAIGLIDQSAATAAMNVDYAANAAQLEALDGFVRRLEERLPNQSMVLQLPFRTYLNFSTIARMLPYEHFKLYLVSRGLRWSFPALSNEQVAWQSATARLTPAKLPYEVARRGFSAIVIDRYGYEDAGAAASAAIRSSLGDNDIIAQTDRYIAFDIRSLADAAALSAAPTVSPELSTAGMGACAGQSVIAIDQVGGKSAMEAPLYLSGSRGFKVTGWAVDEHARMAATGIDLIVDGTPYVGIYGVDRGDVAAALKTSAYSQSGFVAAMPGGTLRPGPHTLSVRAASASRDCYFQGQQIAVIVD